MGDNQIERRLASLESEFAELKLQIGAPIDRRPWWEKHAGIFANDPAFEEAMRLGRQYRESQRPKSTAKRKKAVRNAAAGHRSR